MLAAIQALTPGHFRGQASAALYVLIFIVAFAGIPMAGALTDGLLKDRNQLHLSLAIMATLFGLWSLVLMWPTRHHYVAAGKGQGPAIVCLAGQAARAAGPVLDRSRPPPCPAHHLQHRQHAAVWAVWAGWAGWAGRAGRRACCSARVDALTATRWVMSYAEGMNVGLETGIPVSEDCAVPFVFAGTLHSVKMRLPRTTGALATAARLPCHQAAVS